MISEKIVFIIKGLILLIGFPKNKYPPNTKNYLPCLVIRGGRLVLGGRDCLDLKLAIQWIDLREHLQETIKTTIKYRGFPPPFPLNQFIEP